MYALAIKEEEDTREALKKLLVLEKDRIAEAEKLQMAADLGASEPTSEDETAAKSDQMIIDLVEARKGLDILKIEKEALTSKVRFFH